MIRIPIIATALIWLLHAWHYARSLVPLPKGEDWLVYFAWEQSPSFPSWFFAQDGEHSYILFRLLAWLAYQLGVTQFWVWQGLQFGVFTLLLGVMMRLLARGRGTSASASLASALAIAFTPFLLSTALIENHSWLILINVHLCYLFFFLGCATLYPAEIGAGQRGSVFKAAAWFSLAVLSDSNAVPLTLSAAVLYLVLSASRGASDHRTQGAQGTRRTALLGAVALAAPALLLLVAYSHPGTRPPLAYPWSAEFWLYFLKLCSMVFGFDSHHWLPGVVAVGVAAPAVGALWACASGSNRRKLVTTVCVSGVACLAAVALVRGREWESTQGAVQQRYSEFAVLLLPWIAAAWMEVAQLPALNRMKGWFGSPVTRQVAIGCALMVLAVRGFHHHWNFGAYEGVREARLLTIECIRDKRRMGERALCPQFSEVTLQPTFVLDYDELFRRAELYGFDLERSLDIPPPLRKE